MQVHKQKISELKNAGYNPASRIEQQKIKPLMRSLDKYGILCPISIDKNNVIIDGHRRVAGAKELGWDTIPAITITSDASSDELYSTINTTARRMNGNEQLYVWLRNPLAVAEATQRLCQKAQDDLGRDLLIKMARSGFSITMYRWAMEIRAYLGNERPAFMKKIVNWLLKHRNTKVVHSLISLKQPPEVILKAINEDKPIAARYTVG
jgi:hypothetical protein